MLVILTLINTIILVLLSIEKIKSLLDKTDIDEKVIEYIKKLTKN